MSSSFLYIGTKKAARWIKKTYTHKFNILYGAVRSSKDYNMTIAFVETVKRANYDLFLIGGVDVKNSLRIQGRYILDYLGGLAKKTIYMEAPAIQFKYNGMVKTIIFAGGKNNGSDAGIQGLTLHSVYLTEINLLHVDFVNQAIKRTSSFADAKIFGSFNPKGTRDPFKRNILDIWQRYQDEHPEKHWLNIEHFTLFDNPILTPELIEDIKGSYDPNSISYKRDILGEYTDPEGAVYTVYDYTVLNKLELERYQDYIIVADLGETRSGTAFILAALTVNPDNKQKELHILREYKHLNYKLNEVQRLSQTQYAHELSVFIKESVEIMKSFPIIVLFDGDKDFFNDLKKELISIGYGNLKPKFIPDKSDELTRIKLGQSWLFRGKLRIYKECKSSIEDLRNSQYDEKAYENRAAMQRLSEFDQETGHADTLDAIDYAMLYYLKTIG